ncbi:hypothetical protein T265_01560 [Opisthorchis viverrini]|uniref:Uncharacterized protein n=1 Tax=Opisthorchis viverrini TaxID=6198 RepID=A0A075A258_OPIVI|nr:hypothetical protein T265_01560 [Opisthorchis viverrini]KER32332.1 hypothetical protein T265_01560 [Opisthorchis viverrini]
MSSLSPVRFLEYMSINENIDKKNGLQLQIFSSAVIAQSCPKFLEPFLVPSFCTPNVPSPSFRQPYVLIELKLDCFREIHSFASQFGCHERLN